MKQIKIIPYDEDIRFILERCSLKNEKLTANTTLNTKIKIIFFKTTKILKGKYQVIFNEFFGFKQKIKLKIFSKINF